MKKSVLLLIITFFCGNFCLAQLSAQASFDQANTFFENGEPSRALSIYRSIATSGRVSGPLYLNMGITAVQLDSMGLAKYYFLKAREFESTRAQANIALKYVNSQFSRRSAVLPKLPWDRAVQWLNEGPDADGVFVTGFIITLFGLILLYLGWFNKLNLEKVFSYIITLILLGSTITGLAFYADYVEQRYDEAVLISNSQRVLQSPETESTLVSIAYEGYDLTVDQWKSKEKPGWYYIRLGNGQYGWIQQDEIMVL